MRGRFYVIEGADGVGTTTQARLVAQALEKQGRRVHLTAEPSGGPVGQIIRKMLREEKRSTEMAQEMALLFAADRLDHVRREIAPQLNDGVDVVSDRYVLSSLVYQTLEAGVVLADVVAFNRFAMEPDVTVVVVLPVEVAMERLKARDDTKEMFDDVDTQRAIQDAYRRLASTVRASFVDGNGSREEVCERVMKVIRDR